MFYPFYFHPSIILVFIALAISGWASTYMQSTYQKYSQVKSQLNYTASEICRYILNEAGLQHVPIEPVPGHLTDHYDSQNDVLRLSDATRNSTSVAAIGVAAHEAGHALQDQEDYFFLRLRTSLVPITNIGQTAAMPILMIGLFIPSSSGQFLINLGLALFSLTFIFQLVTLPVEFDASNRAIRILESSQVLTAEEVPHARKVLRAAALTYVAGAIGSFLNILRLFLLFGGNNRNRR